MQESAHGHVPARMTKSVGNSCRRHRLPTQELYLDGRKSHFQANIFLRHTVVGL